MSLSAKAWAEGIRNKHPVSGFLMATGIGIGFMSLLIPILWPFMPITLLTAAALVITGEAIDKLVNLVDNR